MTMRPDDIKNRTFASALRGYDKDEVRSFLHKVAESTETLAEQLAATEAQVAAAAPAIAPEERPDHIVDSDAVVPDALVGVPAGPEPGADLDAVEQAIVDRYGALGDRIADLLRHADQSAAAILAAAENESEATRAAATAEASEVRTDAEQHAAQLLSEAGALRAEVDEHRNQVMAELESARAEQEEALAAAKAAAEAEIETFRVDSIAEIEALRSEARIEVEELRGNATAEVDELRATARHEIEQERESAIVAGRATIAEDESEAARLREQAEDDRRTARAELEDVRIEVSGLLEQARTQSEFIKGEADEIIRTKVRANFEQAQSRLDVLRNTEIASRERILRAQTELTSALTRLDSEPAPELDPASAPEVIEEAGRRVELMESSAFEGGEAGFAVDAAFERENRDITDVVEANEVGQATFEADVAEANQQIDAEREEQSPLAAFADGGDASDDDESGEPGFAAVEMTEQVDETFGDSGAAAGTGSAADTEAAADSFGPASLEESLPPEVSEVGGPAEEDALARLVREAMQEAVDSAREND